MTPNSPDQPDVVGVAEADPVDVDVTGLDAGVERALGQLHVLGDARHRPGGCPRPRCGPWCRSRRRRGRAAGSANSSAKTWRVRPGLELRPGDAAVLRAVDDAFLARDPRRLGVETAHGQEGPLGAASCRSRSPRRRWCGRCGRARRPSSLPGRWRSTWRTGSAGRSPMSTDSAPATAAHKTSAAAMTDFMRILLEIRALTVQTRRLYRTVSFRPLPVRSGECQRRSASDGTGAGPPGGVRSVRRRRRRRARCR